MTTLEAPTFTLEHVEGHPVRLREADHAAQGRPFPADASQVVVMLPDPGGSVTASFAVKHVRQSAAAILVDEAGIVVGTARGPAAG